MVSTPMTDWQGGWGQADASEFAHLLFKSLKCPGVTHCWEKRLMDAAALGPAEEFHSGGHYAPITLQFPEHTTQHTSISIDTLIRAWSQDWSMRSAMISVTNAVTLHVDRFRQDSTNKITKITAALDDFEQCLLPFFLTHNIVVEHCYYDLVAIVVHHGDVHHGHYRTIVRLSPSPNMETTQQWAILDDNVPMQLLPALPEWVGKHAMLLGYVRSDKLSLAPHSAVTDQQTTHEAATPLSHLLNLLTQK